MEQLSQPYREVLVLRDLHDLTAPETAAQLGMSVDAVKSRLHRPQAQVRAHLMNSGYWFEGSEPHRKQPRD